LPELSTVVDDEAAEVDFVLEREKNEDIFG
jgi:hypothetical protein